MFQRKIQKHFSKNLKIIFWSSQRLFIIFFNDQVSNRSNFFIFIITCAFKVCLLLGAVHKRRPQSGGLSSADVCRQEGLQMWTSTLFSAKKLRIFRNLCVRTTRW